jgi:glycosyltransferase involved in cell wall biosynthesis
MALERRLAGMTQGILFESDYARRVYLAQVGTPACPVRVTPNGLLETEFAGVETQATAADFVFVGELRHLKGVDLLIDAMARHDAAISQATAVIVGQGPDEAKFRKQAEDLGIAGRLTFAGAMPARAAFRLGRCLVMPSRAESLPYVVLEAAAAGLPIIATDVGGIPEIVAGTDTALIEPGNVASLAAAMERVLTDGRQALDRAQRLRAAIRGRFSLCNMAGGVLDFYGECLARSA